MARSDHSDRTRAERVQRLRERLKDVAGDLQASPVDLRLVAVLKGVLDLLADEL